MAVLRIDIAGNPKSIPFKSVLEVGVNSLAVLADLDGALEWYMNDLAKNGVLRLEIYSRVKNLKRRELPDVGQEVAASFVRGFDMLEHQSRSPEYLTAKGMTRAQKMTNILGHDGATKLIASIPDTSAKTDITSTSAVNLKKLLPEASQAFGSVEGKLEGISVHDRLDVIVYELFTARR
jgi:hypothetical protein